MTPLSSPPETPSSPIYWLTFLCCPFHSLSLEQGRNSLWEPENPALCSFQSSLVGSLSLCHTYKTLIIILKHWDYYYSKHNCFLVKLHLPQCAITVIFCVLLCTNLVPAWDKDPLCSAWAVQSPGMAGQGEQHLSEVFPHRISFSGEGWRCYGSTVIEPRSAGRSLGYSGSKRMHSPNGFHLCLSLKVLLLHV